MHKYINKYVTTISAASWGCGARARQKKGPSDLATNETQGDCLSGACLENALDNNLQTKRSLVSGVKRCLGTKNCG